MTKDLATSALREAALVHASQVILINLWALHLAGATIHDVPGRTPRMYSREVKEGILDPIILAGVDCDDDERIRHGILMEELENIWDIIISKIEVLPAHPLDAF